MKIDRSELLGLFAALLALGLAAGEAGASSHMDAPLITRDDPANTTDVYAFVSQDDAGRKYLTAALAVYPFEEPGIGPNEYRFDDQVRYAIHIATGAGVAQGRATLDYRFEFSTVRQRQDTILQNFLGRIEQVGDGNQNSLQRYTVTQVRSKGRKRGRPVVLGTGLVPPNNQGRLTPFYNQGDDGDQPAREGVARAAELDRYTAQSVYPLADDHLVFAGQRDDGFYADIQAVFDGLAFRAGADRFDSQGGFNVHTIVLRIPIEELGGDLQTVGVWATTSRRAMTVLRESSDRGKGPWVQVGRQGNPLFCEGLVALADKDRYNRTSPARDAQLFARYAREPELAQLINRILFAGAQVAPEKNREDLVGIFIPDLIRVDLSTPAARLAGGGAGHPSNPDDSGFSRLGVFGKDVLTSRLTGGPVPGGWPNGRRFGDDVFDIAVTAVLNDLSDPNGDPVVADGIDNVSANDIAYNKVFPYAATPLNGRNHPHH
jgi:hypothetical protein